MDDKFVLVLAGVALIAGITHAHTKGQYEPEIARLTNENTALKAEKERFKAQLEGALMD